MGKGAMLLVMATMIGGSIMLFQSEQTVVKTDERQSERQEEVLAREIARSGYSAIVARQRKVEQENPNANMGQVIALVNGQDGHITGTYQDGSYRAWVEQVGAESYEAISVGMFGKADHRIGAYGVTKGTLLVSAPSYAQVTVEESMAGYCSAIFLERWVPKNNNGHGNNVDGCDSSNPGNKDCDDTDPNIDDEKKNGAGASGKKYRKLEPELIFAPGSNRDGEQVLSTTMLNAGEIINVILAVDADYTCEKRGQTVTLKDKTFNYARPALDDNVGRSEMQEGEYAMIEDSKLGTDVWRIAFEDLTFGSSKLNDVKKNGYGGSKWDKKSKTYGGSGWTQFDMDGYRMLQDFGSKPDFSDQVIEVKFVPAGESEYAD